MGQVSSSLNRTFNATSRKTLRVRLLHKESATMSFATRSTLRTVATASEAASRRMSTAPKLHKATEMWGELKKTRPPLDHFDDHVRAASRSTPLQLLHPRNKKLVIFVFHQNS